MTRSHDPAHHGHDHDDHGHSHGPPPAPTPFDPAQESLSQALKAGFRVLSVIMIVLLVAYFFSGLFQVQPGEQGLIARLGKLRINETADSPLAGTPVFGPGWHPALPDPFDEKIRVSGESFKLQIESFCYHREENERGKPLAETLPQRDSMKPGVDGYVLSGDRNLSHGVWTVEYRITAADKFVLHVGDRREAAESLLRRLTESAVVRIVAGMPIEELTRTNVTKATTDFTLKVKRRLIDELNALDSGITIDRITAETIEPGRVREAFIKVTNAQNKRETEISQARTEAERILQETAGPDYAKLLDAIDRYGAAQTTGAADARLTEIRSEIDGLLDGAAGAVAVRLRDAQGISNEIRERARREVSQFERYYEAYQKSPELTTVRLWVRMREAVLSSKANEVFFVPSGLKVIEILANRDPQRLLDMEREQYQERYGGGADTGGH